MDDVQVEDLIVEVEVELENDGDNEKTTDSCDIFKRALESQSDPLPVHSHPGDKINNSREKTPGIVILLNYTSKKRSNEENVCETYELELLKNGETIPVEDLGYVMTVDMRRLLKTNRKKSLTLLVVLEKKILWIFYLIYGKEIYLTLKN